MHERVGAERRQLYLPVRRHMARMARAAETRENGRRRREVFPRFTNTITPLRFGSSPVSRPRTATSRLNNIYSAQNVRGQNRYSVHAHGYSIYSLREGRSPAR